MKKKRMIIITCVAALLLGYLLGSDVIQETYAKLMIRLEWTRTLDYYEYHWRGSTKSQLLSMCVYSYEKRGTQRKCLEYIPKFSVEAFLNSYTLEGFDSHGNSVYQKRITTNGSEEIYWIYTYDEQGRATERAAYADGTLCQLEKYYYDENGMNVDALYHYRNDSSDPKMSSMLFYDANGRELLYIDYENQDNIQKTNWIYPIPDTIGREELICAGDRFVAYRWYEYTKNENISYLLEITPDGADSGHYLCTYTVYDYDERDRLEAVYRYEPVLEGFPCYFNYYRRGDVNTGIYVYFDGSGQLEEIESVYFTNENLPGQTMYSIILQEDYTFELMNSL